MMKAKRIFLGARILLSGVIIGFLILVKFSDPALAQNQNTLKPAGAADPGRFQDNFQNAVIDVAETAGKAVVSISAERVSQSPGMRRFFYGHPYGQDSYGDDDPFRKFFEDFFGEMPDKEYRQVGLGSGVIIDPEGYILTNEHVVSGADKITVTLPDGREFQGEIKGQDPRSDLAVIKINAHKLPVAKLGDSSQVKIGQWVVAIGNPFGFALDNPEPTVTVGVISALHRSLGKGISRERDYSDLIQTDAAINPGNSGGPLVDFNGEVIGINVAIFSTSGGYQGIGFAVPINNAKRIITSLSEGKKIVYGWLGVNIQELNDELIGHFGLPDKNGVLVANLLKNGPADKAGIKEGDCIKSFDGKPINNSRDLLDSVGKSQVGRRAKVVVIRDKKETALTVEVGERPEDVETLALPGARMQASRMWRGLSVENINPVNAQKFRIEDQEGVVVKVVDAQSPADQAGIVAGDVIFEVNKQPVRNVQDYQRVTGNLKGTVVIRTSRGYFILKDAAE
ncbi:MAG: Do family serine endopeptidase [Candidatus Omnitrophota bacterium]|jgi:serine protease Do